MKIKDISISLQKLSNKIIEIVRTSTYITSFIIVLFCISVLRIFVDATFNSLLVLLLGIVLTGTSYAHLQHLNIRIRAQTYKTYVQVILRPMVMRYVKVLPSKIITFRYFDDDEPFLLMNFSYDTYDRNLKE